MVEIWPVGGYSSFGKNMTAVRVGDEVVILDMGASMDKMVLLEERGIEEPAKLGPKDLILAGVIPDDAQLFKEWGHMVKVIVISHAHLDHLWAAIKLAEKYKCPLLMTPFTAEVLNNIIKNEKISFKSKVIRMNAGSHYKVSDKLKIEFVHMTHSTPQTVMTVLHSSEGRILYASDWKFDEYPTLGHRTNYERLRHLAKEGIDLMICDSTRVGEERRTFSESIAKEMFKDILFWTENKSNAIFVATFASHVARVNMLVNMAKELKRHPVILGRSMVNYVSAAERIKLVNISKSAKIYTYKGQIAAALKDVERNREKYFVICTGCQGEPHSVLNKIATGQFKFNFKPEDQVIFGASVIPTAVNRANRAELDKRLKEMHVRIFTDIHVSGHAAREDIRDFIKIMKPKHYIPTHGDPAMIFSAIDLARELGYVLEKNSHILQDGIKFKL